MPPPSERVNNNATATELNANKIYVFKVNKLLPRSEEVSYKDAETQETIKETYKYHLADLNYDNPITEIEANVPYVAVNEDIPKSVAQLNNIATTSNHAPAKAPATKLFSFTGYPTNCLNEYTDENKILTGVHEADVVADEHYVQGTNTQQGYQYFGKDEGSGHKAVAAHRTYIKSTSPDATEDLILFDDDTKITTGVEDVVEEAEAVTAETPTDVYTISGMIVRSQVPYAEALRDLPRGIYTDKPTAIRMEEMTRSHPGGSSGWDTNSKCASAMCGGASLFIL